MKLLTEQNRKQLPALYAQDGKGGQAVAYVKLFTPDSNWTAYITEFDGDDTFYGYAGTSHKELGYLSLSEIKTVRGSFGLPIERDMHFTPTTLEKIKELEG